MAKFRIGFKKQVASTPGVSIGLRRHKSREFTYHGAEYLKINKIAGAIRPGTKKYFYWIKGTNFQSESLTEIKARIDSAARRKTPKRK